MAQHWSVAIHPNAWIPSRAHLPSASHPRKPLSAHITHLSPTFLSTFSTIGITSHPLGASLHPLHPASTQHSHNSQFSPTISSQAPLPHTNTDIAKTHLPFRLLNFWDNFPSLTLSRALRVLDTRLKLGICCPTRTRLGPNTTRTK